MSSEEILITPDGGSVTTSYEAAAVLVTWRDWKGTQDGVKITPITIDTLGDAHALDMGRRIMRHIRGEK